MSEKQKQQLFYAVSYGNQPGIYDNYKDAKAATKGFPEPVLKKFEKREEAEEFLKKSQPESTSYEAKENDTDGKFYAVARGRVIGIFKDMDTVRKNIIGFPNSKHKKFNTFGEAKSYVEKYAEGKVGEKTPKKRARQADEDEEGDDVAVKAVARKRTSGRVGETDESDVGEHMDQTHSSTEENNITTSTTDDGNNTSAENAQEKTTEGEDATKQTAQVEENGDKEKGVEEGKNPETATEEDAAEKNTEEESVEPAKHMEQ